MKVLHVAYNSLGIGGIQNVIMTICRNMRDVSFDILVFAQEKQHFDDEFLSLGGDIFRIIKPHGKSRLLDNMVFYKNQIIQTYKILKTSGPYDAIHCHNAFDIGVTNLAACVAGVPVRIAHSHGTRADVKEPSFMTLYYFLGRLLIKLFSNRYVACSRPSADSMYGKGSAKAIIIYSGIEQERFSKKEDSTIHGRPSALVHVGKFSYIKNQEFLIDMLAELRKLSDTFTLTMIGEGEDEPHIRQQVQKLHLSDAVTILPADSDIPEILKKSDFFIFPSRYEGLGIALVEAQAVGLPCFVSDTVPREVDLGLCVFLSLNKGPRYWAEYIYRTACDRSYPTHLDKDRFRAFDMHETSSVYRKLYAGD